MNIPMKTARNYALSSWALSGLVLLAITGLVFGASTVDEQYKASIDAVNATYDANKASCDNFSGNKKDVCKAQAKAMRDNAKADLDAEKSGTEKASMEASKEKVLSSYKIAKEACDDLPSNLQSFCVENAKTNRDKALATIEATSKTELNN
ncbi:hypothetical protein [Methyloradius palustris]|uniref:Uncharacterized protein n=1 Tax=Methyloradius palustris TaxID=2778876 RepID=A0A8D5JMW3_9PROT|nr:hypothetical protein [Methyloradius palustris]BCM26260.1 hypothetical protein ZMTM_25190 [Methyloradius palustris]